MSKNNKQTSHIDTDILTVQEAADYLKINHKTAYRLAASGKIPGFKIGGAWRFKKSEIDHWISQKSTISRIEDSNE
jgi:excisionase family DNA binding protein